MTVTPEKILVPCLLSIAIALIRDVQETIEPIKYDYSKVEER